VLRTFHPLPDAEHIYTGIAQPLINKIAITGKSFCPAAKEAFETVWANSMRFALVGGIGSIFTLIGKLLITLVTVLIAYLVFTKSDYYVEHLYSPILPCVVPHPTATNRSYL
jgi:hypothetical protein